MLDLPIPDLSFPMVQYGRAETPMDLRVLLYKGGSKAPKRTVFNQIADGRLGRPIIERIELVQRIHDTMTARLVGGGTKATAATTVAVLRNFFGWADQTEQALSLDQVEVTFRLWCDYLLHRSRLNEIKASYAYGLACLVSPIFDAVLDRSQPLLSTTRSNFRKPGPRAVGGAADKQNLADTFAFGHLALDIIDSLSVAAVFGPLPLRIRLRDGRVLERWSGLRDPADLASLQPGYRNPAHTKSVLQTRAEREADRTLRTRSPLVNLRIMAEMMVFIAQTGMNLAQAHQLRRTQFSYRSTIDGYEVRDYKERRKGAVLFEVFAEYRTVFQSYLGWLDAVFADEPTGLLFPLIRDGSLVSSPPDFKRFKHAICKPMGIPFIGPRKLRSTRVNWLLRESRSAEQTAEMAQHTKQTLLRVYEKPSLQVAQSEMIQFWRQNDPRLRGNPMPSPALGVCDGVPTPMPDLPPAAPKPDCTHPAGCLFCQHHRDIDTEEYVWSIVSMRYLQTTILPRFRPPAKGKADAARHVELTIEVLTTKLKWFSESNAIRKAWVEEAAEKIAEGDFHVHWRYLIESAQGV